MLTQQTVIYRCNVACDPAWQFHSMAESIVGGGRTLAEARAEYREALTFSLHQSGRPEVREYVEREIGKLGIWLRLPADHPNFDGVLSQVERQITAHPEHLDRFVTSRTAGGDPVIVTAPPASPLSDILDQMTVHDSLVLAMLYQPPGEVGKFNAWLVITGAEADADADDVPIAFEAMGLTRNSPLRDVLKAALEQQVDKIGALAPC